MKHQYTIEKSKWISYLVLAFVLGGAITVALLKVRGTNLQSHAAQFQRQGVLVSDRFAPPSGNQALGDDPRPAPPTNPGGITLTPDKNLYNFNSNGLPSARWENAPALPTPPPTDNLIKYEYLFFLKTTHNNFPKVSDIIPSEVLGGPDHYGVRPYFTNDHANTYCVGEDCSIYAYLLKTKKLNTSPSADRKILEIVSTSTPSHNFKVSLNFISLHPSPLPALGKYYSNQRVTLTLNREPSSLTDVPNSLVIKNDSRQGNNTPFSQNITITSVNPFRATYDFSTLPPEQYNKKLKFYATFPSSASSVEQAEFGNFTVPR